MNPARWLLVGAAVAGLAGLAATRAAAQPAAPPAPPAAGPPGAAPPAVAPAAAAAFEIVEIRCHIQGITREWVVARLLRDNDLFVGRRFASRSELDAVVADRAQILVNQRTLETARIDVAIEPREGTAAAVRLDVHTKDSWNLMALPYFKYTSNSGLLLAIRGRDYNFLGTMQPLVLNIDYRYTEHQTNEWGAKSSFSLPFRLLAHDWTWEASAGFTYDIDENDIANFGLDLETTLGVEFRLWPDVWTLAYTQGFHMLREADDTYDDDYYNESKLSFGTSIRTGLYLPLVQEVKYKPSVFVGVKYKAEGELSDSYRGVQPGFSHGLAASRVDWIGNFRNGASASLTNTIAYSLSTESWLPSYRAELAAYKAASPWGLSARLSAFYATVNDTKAAVPIRGVLDKDMEGNLGLYWNSDLTLKVFTIPRFAEAQGSFFFDAAMTDWNRVSTSAAAFRYAVGAEGIGFPLFARAFYLRISLGFDVTNFLATFEPADLRSALKSPEIFIGLGHHY